MAVMIVMAVCIAAMNGTRVTHAAAADSALAGGVATLYAHDVTSQTFCFRDGCPGGVIQDDMAKNRCSDVAFNVYEAGALTVAVEGGQTGALVDLGTPWDLARRYGVSDGLNKVQGYASLHYAGDLLIGSARAGDKPRKVIEADALFGALGTNVSLPVKQGHLYVAHLRGDGYDAFVKILVLSYRPDESVTLRWHLLNSVPGPGMPGDCVRGRA